MHAELTADDVAPGPDAPHGWAISPWADSYHHLLELPIGGPFGAAWFRTTVHHVINDGLMAVFFFVVGLEIKREILGGELASVKTAALPMIAALAIVDDIGAVLVIAVFYSSGVAWGPLAAAAGLVVLAVALNRAGARRPWTYGAIGLALWGTVLLSGTARDIVDVGGHVTSRVVLLAL